MSNITNLLELKQKFQLLINQREVINKLFNSISETIDKLGQLYKELTKPNNTELYIICLDTFHFQKVLLNMEYKQLESAHNAISNRLYCDYYKLSTVILHYIKQNFDSKKNTDKTEQNIIKKTNIFKKYPKYDDLDLTKEYSFVDVCNIYDDIVTLLLTLNDNIIYKQNNLENYKKKSENGLKIDNFVYSYESNLNDIDNKLKLFCNYTLFFIDTHNNYFEKFLKKITLVYNEIAEDIKIEETFIDSKENLDDMINITDDTVIENIKNISPKGLLRLSPVNVTEFSSDIQEKKQNTVTMTTETYENSIPLKVNECSNDIENIDDSLITKCSNISNDNDVTEDNHDNSVDNHDNSVDNHDNSVDNHDNSVDNHDNSEDDNNDSNSFIDGITTL